MKLTKIQSQIEKTKSENKQTNIQTQKNCCWNVRAIQILNKNELINGKSTFKNNNYNKESNASTVDEKEKTSSPKK